MQRDDEFAVQCPYCGEPGNIYVAADVHGTLVQDCEVCCNPWRVDVWWEDGERYVIRHPTATARHAHSTFTRLVSNVFPSTITSIV